MRRKELDIDDNYDDSLELKRLENLNKLVFSDFRNVRIDSTTLDVFKTFDDRLSDKHADEDIIFQHSIPLTRVEEFISQYRGAKTIEELNTIIQ